MDERCEPVCSLRCGFSSRFEKNLETYGKNGECSKLPIAQGSNEKKPETWRDMLQNISLDFDHTNYDCTESMKECQRLKNWKTEFEQVMKTINNEQYQDLFDGEQKHLGVFPPHFRPLKMNFKERKESGHKRKRKGKKDYNEYCTLPIEFVQEKLKLLGNKRSPSEDDNIEFNDTKEYLSGVFPDYGESKVYYRLIEAFNDEEGVLLNSWDVRQNYLKPLQTKFDPTVLTCIEQTIAKLLRIQDLLENSKHILAHLDNNGLHQNYSGLAVKKAIDEYFEDPSYQRISGLTAAKNKFKEGGVYRKGEIKATIDLEVYRYRTQQKEIDNVLILPNRRLIVCIEVKSKRMHLESSEQLDPFQNISKGGRQLEDVSDIISRTFGPLLSQDWKLIKILALVGDHNPTVVRNICSFCKPYVINDYDLQTRDKFNLWVDKLGILKIRHGSAASKDTRDQGHIEFLQLFTRMVILSGIIFQKVVFSPWVQITGDTSKGYGSQYICPNLTKVCGVGLGGGIRDIAKRPNDAWKILHCTPQQQSLLYGSGPRHLAIFGDFGTGNQFNLYQKLMAELDCRHL